MVKRFSKKYGTREELSTNCNPKVMSQCLSVPDATSLHHCLQNYGQYFTIREYGSTLYVGLASAIPSTNTNFQSLLLPTQAGMLYTNTHKHRTSYFKSTLTFMGPAKRWKCLSAA